MADSLPQESVDHLNFVELTKDPLDLKKYTKFVHDTSAGAVATFSGVTRDNFQGKKVLRLEYEAYEDMAVRKLKEICQAVRSSWSICKIALAHRLGFVDIGESSVMIAISSTHRKEALESCHFAIDEIKAIVPIWKKEVYEEGAVWKENSEFKDRFGV